MFTVSKLARSCGLSRSTLLYYESVGLLKAAARPAGNYRSYGEKDLQRLQQICVYRDAGLRLADIRAILERPENDAASVLKRRLVELNAEIQTLRGHQRSILKLLQNKNSFRRTKRMTKEKWVSIMRASGLTDTDMHRWHVEFERSAPDDHQTFLEFLHIPAPEIRSIREWSRKAQVLRPGLNLSPGRRRLTKVMLPDRRPWYLSEGILDRWRRSFENGEEQQQAPGKRAP